MHASALEPPNSNSDDDDDAAMLSSSFASAVSVASLPSIASSSSCSSSFIRSRRRAPATTLATSPATKAIVIPSKTDAATYVAATIESFPKSTSPLGSYDDDSDDLFYSSFETLSCYDEFKFVITEFGVISQIKTKPVSARHPLQASYKPSPMVGADGSSSSSGGGGLASLARICASALGIGGFGASADGIADHVSGRAASRISPIMLDPSKAVGQPIFRYVHNDDLPILCRTLSRAHDRVARCAIRWTADMDRKAAGIASSSRVQYKGGNTDNATAAAAQRQPGSPLRCTSLRWRWVWISIRQYDSLMICTLRRPLDEDYDEDDEDEDDDAGSSGTVRARSGTFSGLSEYLLSFLLPSTENDEEEEEGEGLFRSDFDGDDAIAETGQPSAKRRIWQQRYREQHSLNDDEEIRWLQWYIKTLYASGLLAPSADDDDCNIDWFRAYCHRRACDANLFKNDPKRVKDIEEAAALGSRKRAIVLDRIFMVHSSLDECHVLEHCQPKATSSRERYWRNHRLHCAGADLYVTTQGNTSITDTFLTFTADTSASQDAHRRFTGILVWPVSRMSSMEPRRLPYPKCKYLGIRGRWLLFSTRETHASDGVEMERVLVHVMDLATARSSVYQADAEPWRVHLQRVTEDTATVLFMAQNTVGERNMIDWSLWQFSVSQVEGSPCCLMRGSYQRDEYSYELDIRRVDDDRFIIVHPDTEVVTQEEKPNEDILTLAVMSTQHSGQEQPVDNKQPVWSRYTTISFVKEMIAQERIVVFSGDDWFVHSLYDGSILSRTSVQTIEPILDAFCSAQADDNFYMPEYYWRNYVLCPSKDGESLIAVDIVHPERTGKLKHSHLFDRYNVNAKEASFLAPSSMEHQPFTPAKRGHYSGLTISVCSIHALHVVIAGYEYKMLDLSVDCDSLGVSGYECEDGGCVEDE
ncbi:hypothetical protein SYNPS1DRAFT_26695 [Syncephalis pseudoplumigaleata]|uniref:Uncharacterized protein n=1 Tax=Syncephalis pseudoplumigaleata TaxID=1712513 RepID=A0A4P9Z4Z2_9FUNG|nr:hypothetical protein SYNPS1DRAFT_26695 [Syncephalis pseudoplumigaleata]|eukprot:RKP27667.1 hypothetical protein SYNPS1DRAFT_26695 [Syncephalis pseudoplumigaleata]